ncbi:MAG: AI-2E family transporter YdiK [Planctomycetes bacterium]|nr:AI-2E family transporter YdiK [Planctomycetota bacterium]
MDDPTPSRDLARTVFAVLFLGLLLVGSLWVLAPFLPAVSWAALLVIATWPVLRRLQTWFGGRRGPAVAVMLMVLLLAFLLPVGLAIAVLVERAPAIAAWLKALPEQTLPPPPEWLANVPLVGARAFAGWAELAAEGAAGLRARVAPYADDLAAWLVTQVGGAGLLFVHFLLTLLLAGVFYARGESFAGYVRGFVRRLAGERGDRAAVLAAQATRAVALGIVVTAVVQAALGGLGLALAGVPASGLLTAVLLLASVAQIGAAPVLVLASVWLFANDRPGWGIAMLAWAVLVGSIDNVVRPLLIKKGVDLPLLLVFFGVVGGLLAFGVRGLFLGPVVLAVSHTLLAAWIREGGDETRSLVAPTQL